MPQRQRPLKRRDGKGTSEDSVSGSSGSKGGPPARAYIRKWIHERAVSRLRQVVWEGYGSRLLQETSATSSIRKFLAAVPRVLAAIKEVHALAIADEAELLKARSAPPSPRELLLSRDANGLTPLHKAAGLGNVTCVKVLLSRVLDAVGAADDEGKLPLHYAAYAVGSSSVSEESKELTYHLLVEAGSDEGQKDKASGGSREERASPPTSSGAAETPDQTPSGASSPPTHQSLTVNPLVDASTSTASAPSSPPNDDPHPSPGPPSPHPPPADPSPPSPPHLPLDHPPPSPPPPSLDHPPPAPDDAHPEARLGPMTLPGIPPGVKEEIVVRQYSIDEERSRAVEGEEEASMTSERAIESPGVRKGAEEGMDSRSANIDDEEIRRAAREGDIGVMVSVVLSGEGERLLGLTSPDPKTQNFLSNVPAHMEMIGSIHEAASKGRLREVQARLDRRKFAIAKEPFIGATPLHSAVLGAWLRGDQPTANAEGESDVMAMAQYLGGRFPESLNQRDRFGRTPLHYACALAREDERLKLYEELKKLGADPAVEDNMGLTPEYYMSNPKEFPHEDLLPFMEYLKRTDETKEPQTRFSYKEIAQEETSDPAADESQESSTETDEASTKSNEIRQPMDPPVLWTEEGQYLARSLGEPLVRGLAEVSQKRPKDPVKFLAEYLQALAAKEEAERSARELGGIPLQESTSLANSPPAIPDDILQNVFHSREERDKHGQTAIHATASRPGNQGALLQLIRETGANVALRDELYKTPRDVAMRADLQQNVREIDTWIQMLIRATPTNGEDNNGDDTLEAEMAARMLKSLLLDGYDHILDATSSYADGDNDEHSWSRKRNLDAERESSYLPIITLLKTIPIFEERREWLHSAIRAGSLEHTQEILFSESESFDETNSIVDTPPPSLPTSPSPPNSATNDKIDSPQPQKRGNMEWAAMDFSLSQESSSSPLVLGPATLAIAKNRRSRCSMHVAVLCQHLEIVRFIAQHFPQTLHIGDNLERTPLHYAMGVKSVDSLSSVLIQAGAKRVQKDLRGKQPSYYFINKSDIQKLEDEEIFRD